LLKEKLKIGLYDSKGRPRLFYAQNYFQQFGLDVESNFKELQDFYLEWRTFDEYLVLQKQTENLRVKGEVIRKTIAIKCPKRGNDICRRRLWKRLKFLYEFENTVLFDPHGNVKTTNVMLVTLTYDTKRSRIQDAWKNIGDDFNKYMRNLRRKFGRISYLRCWESSQKGYPHIHVLMMFQDYSFRVKRINGKYRIEEKEAFEKSYHSFVDVQAVRNMKKGIRYVTKYLSKSKSETQTQVLTLALCWLFRKQSFAVSGYLKELMQIFMASRQRRLIQTDLMGNEVSLKVVWVFIGFFSAEKLGITHNEWWKVITDLDVLNDKVRPFMLNNQTPSDWSVKVLCLGVTSRRAESGSHQEKRIVQG